MSVSAPPIPVRAAPGSSSRSGRSGLSPDDLVNLASELDALRAAVSAELGQRDADYIRSLIRVQRGLDVAARASLLLIRRRSGVLAGTAMLTLAKVLENMEIGHNVMHGQYDWMKDPTIHSSRWEWEAVSTASGWKYAHNFEHHTFTNVVGRDRDLGYSAMRVDPAQEWHPIYLLQLLYGVGMALTFEWGIAIYDMNLAECPPSERRIKLGAFLAKASRQVAKDFVLWPALSGRRARQTALANLAANVARNVWVHTIVFMGHLPEPAETFSEEETARESRGEWYVRQLTGSCNLEGTRLFHILSGSLSYQIEHHLFPDLPSCRYPQIAPQVKAICERYGLPYNSGRLGRQYLSVARKIARNSLP